MEGCSKRAPRRQRAAPTARAVVASRQPRAVAAGQPSSRRSSRRSGHSLAERSTGRTRPRSAILLARRASVIVTAGPDDHRTHGRGDGDPRREASARGRYRLSIDSASRRAGSQPRAHVSRHIIRRSPAPEDQPASPRWRLVGRDRSSRGSAEPARDRRPTRTCSWTIVRSTARSCSDVSRLRPANGPRAPR